MIPLFSLGLGGCPSQPTDDARASLLRQPPPTEAAPGGLENGPPTLDPLRFQLEEDTRGTLVLSASDPDGDPLRFRVHSLPQNMLLVDAESQAELRADQLPVDLLSNALEIVPDPDWFGESAFTVSVTDGLSSSPLTSVRVVVTPANDAPAFVQRGLVIMLVDEDSPADQPTNQLLLSATDIDTPAAALQFRLGSAPNFGRATLKSAGPGQALLSYAPNAGYIGFDLFDVQVSDGGGGLGQVQLQVVVSNISIAGRIEDRSGQPYAGVELELRGENGVVEQRAVSDFSGFYAFIVPRDWSGSITSSPDYRFEPAKRPYQRVITSINRQDLVAFRNFYVAPNGSNSGAGRFVAPYRTIQTAADAARPGDHVLVRAGTYTTASDAAASTVLTLGRSSHSGTLERPIVYRAYQSEPVLIDGRQLARELVVIRADFVQFDGFELANARRSAVVVEGGAQHVTVRNCFAHDNRFDTAFVGGAFRTNGSVQHVTFEDCVATRNVTGFELREAPTQTSATAAVPPHAGNIGYAADLPEDQWSAWPGWTDFAARYCTIRNCIAYANNVSDEHSNGIVGRYAIECVIDSNIAFANSDDNIDLVGATRCVVSHNIAFDADPAGTAAGDGNGIKIGVRGGLDNLAHNNVCFSNRRAGIDMADSERSEVYNNTLFDNGWFGLWFEATRANVGGMYVVNNIARTLRSSSNGDIGFNGGTRLIFADTNLVSGPHNHNWAKPLGSGSQIGVNPLFVNEDLAIDTAFPPGLSTPQKLDFIRNQVHAKLALSPASPAVDAGTKLGILGPSLGAGVDLGAIESH